MWYFIFLLKNSNDHHFKTVKAIDVKLYTRLYVNMNETCAKSWIKIPITGS